MFGVAYKVTLSVLGEGKRFKSVTRFLRSSSFFVVSALEGKPSFLFKIKINFTNSVILKNTLKIFFSLLSLELRKRIRK